MYTIYGYHRIRLKLILLFLMPMHCSSPACFPFLSLQLFSPASLSGPTFITCDKTRVVCSKRISALYLWLLTCICVFGDASIVAVIINRLLISLETLAIRRVVHAIQWVQSVRIHTLLCFSFSYLLFDAKNAKAKKKNHRSRNCYNECSIVINFIVWKTFGYRFVGLNGLHTSHLCRLVWRR